MIGNRNSLPKHKKNTLLHIKTFLIQAIISEQWLRFYCLHETKNDQLYIQVSKSELQLFQKKYPELYPLIQQFNGIVLVDANISYEKIHTFSFGKYGNAIYNIMNSTSFQKIVTSFQQWVQEKALFLEKNALSFDDWIKLCTQDIIELQEVYS